MTRSRKLARAGVLAIACGAIPGVGDGALAWAQASASPAKLPTVPFVTADELKARMAEGAPVTFLDVRASDAYASSDEKISGAIRIQLRKLRSRLAFAPLRDLPRDGEIVTYCACPADEAGVRAAEILQEAGFKRVRVLKGGWQAWRAAGGPIEQRPRS